MTTLRQRIALAIVMATAAAIYLARLDRAAGLFVDDAWYVLLGRSLSQGDGFRLISSAASAILPSVPPGFPAVLALVFRLRPSFPDNVLLLKAVSVAAMIATGALTWEFMTRVRRWPAEIAATIAALTMVTPAFVFLATSTVMAECLFACVQLAAILAIEHAAETESAPRWRAVGAGLTAGAAWLIKTSATPLVIGGVVYLALRRRRYATVAFGAAALAVALPWQLYARAHAPTPAERSANGGSIAIAYGDSLRLRIAGFPRSGYATPSDIAVRVAANIVNVAARDVNGVFVPAFLRGPDESGEEIVALGGRVGLSAGSMGNARASEVIGVVFTLVAIAGFVATVRRRASAAEIVVPLSLAMVVLVPFHTFRYVLPLTPFLVGYFVDGLQSFGGWRLARIALLSLVTLDLVDHAQYIALARTPTAVNWLADAREVDETIAWVEAHLPPGASVASSNPGLVYLRTGRKGVTADDIERQRGAWLERGIRYVVMLGPSEPPAESNGAYRRLYRSPRGLWVLEL